MSDLVANGGIVDHLAAHAKIRTTTGQVLFVTASKPVEAICTSIKDPAKFHWFNPDGWKFKLARGIYG